ncbi:MAG: YbaK/EbsC family protein [Bacilli bacterium]
MDKVFNFLDTIDVKYEIVYHPAVFSTEEADKFVEGKEGVLSKTLFMAGKKDHKFYLFIMDDSKRLDIKKMSKLVDDKLHFAKEEHLMKKMGLKPGVVSIFGLLNNDEHDINIYIDKEVMSERIITFYPNDNTATIFISTEDMIKYFDKLKYKYNIIEF